MNKLYTTLLLCIFFGLVKASAGPGDDIFKKLNPDNPSLKPVKAYYDQGELQHARKALLNIFRQKENLYIRVSPADRSYIRDHYKEEVRTSIKTADEVRDKYFLFRYEWDMEKTTEPYQFKKEIDWYAEPFGDEEWTFMLNRHRYWTDLGRAYFITGKEKYVKTFVEQVTHWIDQNPILESNQWKSWRRIEAGIRAENWIKTFELVKNSKHITPEFLEKFLNALYIHAEFIDQGYSRHSQMSNWGVLEFHGLFNLAAFLSEFRDAEKWQQSAIARLNTCIQNQILEDGTQWEQSPMYHNEVFHCYLNTILLSQRKNIALPETTLQKTRDMAYADIEWQKPNYHEPLLGDSDDNDLRALLTTAAIVFKDKTIKSRAHKELDYENFFVFGTKMQKEYRDMVIQEPDFLSAYQQSSGDLYSRSSWKEDAYYSSFHIKRLGGGHSHDNLLHFTLFAKGRDYLIDGGRYTYVNNKWRKYFKDNSAHNTLGVDGLPNSEYGSSWGNSYEARSEGAFTRITENYDYAEAINTAYLRLKDPVWMKRQMLYLKPDVWLLVDSFHGKEEHTYSSYFNFPDKQVEVRDGGLSTTLADHNLRIQPLNELSVRLEDAWWSPEYNFKTPVKRAELSKKEKGFASFITLLYFPEKDKLKYEKVPVYNRQDKIVPDNEAEAVKITLPGKEYTLVVAHRASKGLNTFLLVDDQVLSGEVILMEQEGDTRKIHVIK
ncbi:alginate lyase family protein [Sinomicrobium weinanense]|uniref:Alginate lyase family protein n=1 Tax=Sinomicrobium weinanense TaxID=2842200 RepID=A0A926Q2H5_9FLAO|nr:alginate lyase family protein [Sinomicrobium weinanense]MBC9794665.1 alginate lyase family protein [Sinomicrobium weinanense]MBU3124150.1 heparinase II/III family protein [Sinomicrobium weinanense]